MLSIFEYLLPMKRLLFLLLIFSFGAKAQDFTNSWSGHYSYYNIKKMDFAEGRIYAAAENSVFIHDLQTNTSQTLSSINGLSGGKISSIHYSETYNVLVLGYENGLLEVKRDDNETIFSFIDIVQKPTIPATSKKINHFHEVEGQLIISTGYGISMFNLENLEFADTYFIGNSGEQLNVLQSTVHNNNIYAATAGSGIKFASLDNPNLIDYSQWQSIAPTSTWKGIVSVGDFLYAMRSNNDLFRVEGTTISSVGTLQSVVRDMWGNGNFFYVTAANKAVVYDANANQVALVNAIPEENFNLNTSFYQEETFYLGHRTKGLIKYNPSTSAYNELSPAGPLYNSISDVEAAPNQLWAVFDEYNVEFNPYIPAITARGASHFVEDEWQHFSSSDLFGVSELVNVTINPNNPGEVYLSSFLSGMVKVVDDEPIMLYNETNGLDDIDVPNGPSNTGDVRINGADFDNQGNIWLTNSRVDKGLKVITPQGNVDGVDITSIITDPFNDNAFTDLTVDSMNNVFFGTEKNGVVAYQTSTGELTNFENNLPSDEIRALAVDINNVLWIGTDRGLRVLYNPSSIFSQNISPSSIIILDEDGVAQELLFEQFIMDIEVDGSNNKWIATASSGVFHVSSNGQETLAHYTIDNSPLPSNNVTSISIDHSSGRVYFGTVDGLVSVKGNATQARNNLDKVYAYPNPVRPNFTGNVVIDGLMQNANVKITDIEGNLVYEEVSQGGSILWDTTAFGRHKVASGVYLVLITSEDQAETKVTKIMVIR